MSDRTGGVAAPGVGEATAADRALLRRISVTINGRRYEREVDVRLLLSDFIRHECGLTGTHVGCEHGVCGACTVQLDGEPVRSCLMFAVQAEGAELLTVEGMADPDGPLHPIQEAFRECHGLQCGFCTPGFLTTVDAFLREHPEPTEQQVREGISGNLCRCTGYQGIVDAVLLAAKWKREGRDFTWKGAGSLGGVR